MLLLETPSISRSPRPSPSSSSSVLARDLDLGPRQSFDLIFVRDGVSVKRGVFDGGAARVSEGHVGDKYGGDVHVAEIADIDDRRQERHREGGRRGEAGAAHALWQVRPRQEG